MNRHRLVICAILCAAMGALLTGRAFAASAGSDVASLEKVFAAAVARVSPSLVSVQITWKPGKGIIPPMPATPGSQAMPAFQRGAGPVPGVIISSDGLIATSDFSVNADVASARVRLADGRSFDAKLLGQDVSRGIQILQVDAKGLPVPAFADNAEVQVGRWALVCGVNESGAATLSVGIVSATERMAGRAIQIDARTNPSNYGGALVDVQGRLLGIVTPMSSSARAGLTLYDSGIGFAVPIGDLMKQMPKLKAGETVHSAFLGIMFDSRKMNGGALIQSVLPGTGAQKAGMKAGDTITEFQGTPIDTSFKLLHAIGRCCVGDVVTFKVTRDGKPISLTATLGPRPDNAP